jgi:hypothetical protein
MPPTAPLRVPVEIRRAGAADGRSAEEMIRCFRLGHEVSEEGLLLGVPVPDDLDGPVELSFFLPEDERPVAARGSVVKIAVSDEEEATRRGLRFLQLDEETRGRIARYVLERSAIP